MCFAKECVSTDMDKVTWEVSKGNDFYMLSQPTSRISFPEKGIWVSYVPQKNAFIPLEASWGKVHTLDKLQRRG